MLDDFKNEQDIIYKVLINSINKNKYSHAYLFELNGYTKGLDFVLAFAKFLLCPNSYSNSSLCNDCTQCRKINTGNFLELKIINPDGQWIKKEQLEELQREFTKKSLIGNKKVYIINDAEKLNISAANSLLKFLEEPPEGIYAILVTNNIYQLLNTIISRCQILSLKKQSISSEDKSSIYKIGEYLFSDSESLENFVNNDGIKFIDSIIEYILFFEKNHNETIAYKNKEILDVFNDRRKLSIAFDLFVLYYKDVLNHLFEVNCEYFNDYIDSINSICNRNTIESISKKIKVIVDLSVNIKYNLNANLLLDKLVILLSEV